MGESKELLKISGLTRQRCRRMENTERGTVSQLVRVKYLKRIKSGRIR
jgi:hypothetical protein